MPAKRNTTSKRAIESMIIDVEAIRRRQIVELDQLEAEVAAKKAELAKTDHQLLKLSFQKDYGEEY